MDRLGVAMKPVIFSMRGMLEARIREHCEMFRRCHNTLARMFEIVEERKTVEGFKTTWDYGALYHGDMSLEIDMGSVWFGAMLDAPASGPYVYVEKMVDEPKAALGCRSKGGKHASWEDAAAFVMLGLSAEIGPTEAAKKVERCMRLTLDNESRHFDWWPKPNILFTLAA